MINERSARCGLGLSLRAYELNASDKPYVVISVIVLVELTDLLINGPYKMVIEYRNILKRNVLNFHIYIDSILIN